MKRILIVLVLVSGIAAAAFATYSLTHNKSKAVKKQEMKKHCNHVCPYYS